MRLCSLAAALGTALLVSVSPLQAAPITLYDQDFENPVGYNNDGGDVSIFRTVNDHYANQPAGFEFAQTFTVETLNVSGSERNGGSAAFGTGWDDPTGQAGNFAIGMLSTAQNDLLGLNFNVGAFDFLNFQIDVSSIDLSTFGGPFVPIGAVPTFRFTLYDNPTGNLSVGTGTILDQVDFSGTASDRDTFDWTTGAFGLSTEGNTNGNVTFQIDLLVGGYGAFDNLKIVASNVQGEIDPVPLPASLVLLLGGLGGLSAFRRRSA